MNVGSLFSGVGGMDYGLHRAGFTHVFFAESDEWRRSVLAHHWPGVPCYDDVRAVGEPAGRAAADGAGAPVDDGGGQARPGVPMHSDAPLDLLCGGFPCQDLSVAGNRAGLAGERSGLFYEFARIIDALRPRWVLIENVPGLLSSNGGRDFGIVLGTLADVGYGVGWRVLDSRFFGVPQRRRRVFILATQSFGDPRGAAERAGQVLAVGSRCTGHSQTGGEAGQGVAGTLGGGAGERGWAQDVERMTFLPTEPQTFAWQTTGTERSFIHDEPGRARALGTSQTLAVWNPSPAIGVRRLTPTECERLQGLPDGWTDHGPDSRRYSALGDAVTSSVAFWIGKRLMEAVQ